MSKAKPFSPRGAAVAAVMAVTTRGEALDEALNRELGRGESAPARDRALAFQIAVGTIRHLARLDHLLTACMKRPLSNNESWVWAVLRTALYQGHFMRVPPHAAVNEAVDLVKGSTQARLAGFVNAVLRAALRLDPEAVATAVTDPVARLALMHSHPPWLSRRWVERLGLEGAARRMAANNEPGPLVLRVNTLRTEVARFHAALAAAGVAATPGARVAEAVVLAEHHGVEGLPGYGQGWFAVQDQAAQWAARILDPQPGERILDACAAPGGKAAHIMALAPVTLVAVEKLAARAAVMVENFNRLGVTGVEIRVGDSGEVAAKLGRFDRILVDAPCSGTGVIRRHPDIKLRRTLRDLHDLVAEQGRILDGAAACLKPGGRLVYAVCSLEPEEGEERIAAFLQGHPGWRVEPVAAGEGSGEGIATPQGCLAIEPGWEGMDGFFIACLRAPDAGS